MKDTKPLLIALTLSCCLPGWTQADVYYVDAKTNVVGGLSKAVVVPLSQPDQYTLTLKASDFTESYPGQTPQRHVVVLGGSGLGDWRTFALNGLGDSRTIYCDMPNLWLFFVDGFPQDNSGSSTVEVSRQGSLVGDYVVDGQTNVLSDLSQAVVVPLSHAGLYSITLTASDFTESSPGQTPQRHVVVLGGSGLGDLRTFTLNGVGSTRTVYCDMPHLWLFFVDDLASDNTGGTTVEVAAVPPPLTLQVASVALSWPTVTNQSYQLQYATDLSPDVWVNLGVPVAGTGTNALVFDSILNVPHRFYRLQFAP